MTEEQITPPLRPFRALLNGLYAWVLGFILYILPGIGIGFRMGYDLGREGVEQAEISRQISVAAGQFYHTNPLVALVAALVMGGFVYWRAHVVSRGAGSRATARGVLVAAIPIVIDLIWAMRYHIGFVEVLAVALILAAGILGARRGAAIGKAATTPAG